MEQLKLPPNFEDFISTMVSSGRYDSRNDFIEVAVSMLKRWEEARDEISKLSQVEYNNLISLGKAPHEKLLDDVEEFIGRNSTKTTGTKPLLDQ